MPVQLGYKARHSNCLRTAIPTLVHQMFVQSIPGQSESSSVQLGLVAGAAACRRDGILTRTDAKSRTHKSRGTLLSFIWARSQQI